MPSPSRGILLYLENLVYQGLSTSSMGLCTLGYILPTISVADITVPIHIPLSTTHRGSKRGVTLIPILIGISSLAGIATGTTGTISANNVYVNLSLEIT